MITLTVFHFVQIKNCVNQLKHVKRRNVYYSIISSITRFINYLYNTIGTLILQMSTCFKNEIKAQFGLCVFNFPHVHMHVAFSTCPLCRFCSFAPVALRSTVVCSSILLLFQMTVAAERELTFQISTSKQD